jgi:hypothetical protein
MAEDKKRKRIVSILNVVQEILVQFEMRCQLTKEVTKDDQEQFLERHKLLFRDCDQIWVVDLS